VILPLFLTFALTAAVEAAPSAVPVTLREIGRSRSPNGVCGNLVVHANSAIAAALHNDQVLARAIARLRSIDFENNALTRRNGLAELGRLAAELHDQSVHGDDELRRLDDLSGHSNETRHEEVRAFSDALGGAFSRQRAVASDLSGFLNFLEYRELRDVEGGIGDPNHGALDSLGRPASTLSGPPAVTSPYEASGSPNRMAQTAAGDFESRVAGVQLDETRAALHSEPAVTGCS